VEGNYSFLVHSTLHQSETKMVAANAPEIGAKPVCVLARKIGMAEKFEFAPNYEDVSMG
jgi:hypothetical protein